MSTSPSRPAPTALEPSSDPPNTEDLASLRAQLEQAHSTLAEKEKDLQLAAEIGQSLLHYNNELREHIHALTGERKGRSAKDEQTESCYTGNGEGAPEIRGRRHVVPRASSRHMSLDATVTNSDVSPSSSPTSPYNLADPRGTVPGDAAFRPNIAHIDHLEQQNAELVTKIDHLTAELQLLATTSRQTISKLEDDLSRYQFQSETLAFKNRQLEEQTAELVREKTTLHRKLGQYDRRENEDDEKIRELNMKLRCLNQSIVLNKNKLARTLSERDVLEEKCVNLESELSRFKDLQRAVAMVDSRASFVAEKNDELSQDHLADISSFSTCSSRYLEKWHQTVKLYSENKRSLMSEIEESCRRNQSGDLKRSADISSTSANEVVVSPPCGSSGFEGDVSKLAQGLVQWVGAPTDASQRWVPMTAYYLLKHVPGMVETAQDLLDMTRSSESRRNARVKRSAERRKTARHIKAKRPYHRASFVGSRSFTATPDTDQSATPADDLSSSPSYSLGVEALGDFVIAWFRFVYLMFAALMLAVLDSSTTMRRLGDKRHPTNPSASLRPAIYRTHDIRPNNARRQRMRLQNGL